MVGHEIWQEKLKNVQNEKHTLQNLEYGEKQRKRENQKYTLQDAVDGKKFEKHGK